MCLYIDKDKTEREKLKGALRTFYKVFVREERTLLTPYFKWPIRAPGAIKAPPPDSVWLKYNEGMVGPGAFHARVLKEALKQDLFWIDQFDLGSCIILEIPVQVEAIVADGNQDNVAFTEYEITEAMWEDAFKQKRATLKDLL